MSIMQILSVSILCAIIEEIVFRGVIFGFLRKNYNIIIAIIVQALVFAVFHYNILQSIYTFVLGIVLALINVYGNSLYGNIVAHVIYNILGVFIIPTLPDKISFGTYILIGLILFSFGTIKIINSRTKLNIS